VRTEYKYKRFIFSALLTIWAVAFAAAQEHFVVTVGETRSYFVEEHEGSEYNWIVFNEPAFTIQSAETEVGFPVGNTGHQIDILWKTPGVYYIAMRETDLSGCVNKKAIAVTVIPNDRSVGFALTERNTCFDALDNSFVLPLIVLDNKGSPLTEEFFPLKIKFEINGQIHSESIKFSNKQLLVNNEWFSIGPELNTQVTVEITEASDVNDVPLEITTGTFTQTIYALPEIEFAENSQDTIPLNTFHAFEISGSSGYTYDWWYKNAPGETVSFTSENNTTEEVFWDTEGDFELFVQATDVNGCLSEIISKPFTVTEVEGFISSLVALPDINVGYENTTIYGDVSINDFDFMEDNPGLQFAIDGETPPGLVFVEDGTYEYTPPEGFTDKTSFSYRVCYTNYADECAQTDVTIHVIPENTGENIPPVAATDAALTLPNQTVFSNLLANDIDPDGYGVSLMVNTEPVQPPSNGVVSINSDGSFAYTPNPGFTGIDRFRYSTCDNGIFSMCDSAWVYVFVDEFGDTGQKPVSASDDVFLHVAEGIYSLRENDYDLLGENLVYNTQPVITPEHGSLEIFPDGTFTYSQDDGFVGADRFVYEVCNTENPPVCRQGTGFILVTPGNDWVELAGKDTTIGNCNPFILNGFEVDGEFNYSWSPGYMLDDSTKINPAWQPTETTVFTLTVSNEFGFSITDTVTVTVADVLADAGEDVFMYSGETAVLDGSNSSGEDIEYLWTTETGTIDSGANTASPVVSGFGNYLLEVTDRFGCTSADTINVGRLTYAPIAQNDYDSTGYRSEVEIYVLDNDYDPDNDIDSLSLLVSVPPMSGNATVNSTNFTIIYTPDENFNGSDQFKYQICDEFDNCDEANVFVMVSDFRFFIPNAFSPNGDGINDYFEILGIEYYEGNSIEIFNRWGNRVYKAENYGIANSPVFWDGKSNTRVKLGNEDLPTGTYFYVLDLGNGEKRIVGSVYLDR
jgi:gliding motility-associated-like protein